MFCQIIEKSIHRLPAILATVQGVVYPLTGPLFRLGGQIGCIEEYQVELASDALKQICSYSLDSPGPGRPHSMGIYVRGQETGDVWPQLLGDKAATAANLQHAVRGPGLG